MRGHSTLNTDQRTIYGRKSTRGAGLARYALSGLLLLIGVPSHAAGQSNGLTEHSCRLEAKWLPAVLAQCSHLVVPENPAKPDGETLSLFVARIPALTATPRPDPLVLIAGGPGQSTVDLYLQLRQAFAPIRRTRDILLLDQRGTGRSADGYHCSLPEDIDLDTSSARSLKKVMKDCLSQLKHDPRFYSTSPAVADLEALRRTVGARQWNLYGVSYGTRVAQQYARRYPAHTRSMILDGVVPAELALGPEIATNAQHALYDIFARCAADKGCGSHFPELGHHFETLMRRLRSNPVTVQAADPLSGELETHRLTATRVASTVRLMSYSAPTVALLPLAIDQAYSGHYRMLSDEAAVLLESTAEALNLPMHNSVVCTEDVPFFPDDAGQGLDDTYLGSKIIDSLEAICSVWPRGVMDKHFKEPVKFEGPVLFLSGQNDPVTPPEYAIAAMAHGMRNSIHLVGKGQGHGMAAVGCVPQIMAQFIKTADPGAVDSVCLDAEKPTPFFLSTRGPGP